MYGRNSIWGDYVDVWETTTVSEGINIGCPQWMGDETDARWCLLILYVREGRKTMSYGDVEYEDEQA